MPKSLAEYTNDEIMEMEPRKRLLLTRATIISRLRIDIDILEATLEAEDVAGLYAAMVDIQTTLSAGPDMLTFIAILLEMDQATAVSTFFNLLGKEHEMAEAHTVALHARGFITRNMD